MKNRLKAKKKSANERTSRRTENQPYEKIIFQALWIPFTERYSPETTMGREAGKGMVLKTEKLWLQRTTHTEHENDSTLVKCP